MEKYKYSDEEFAFLEQSQIPFAIYQYVDNRVQTIVLSNGFFRLFGYENISKEEVYELTENDRYRDIHPDDRAMLLNLLDRFVGGGEAYDALYRTRKNNEYHIIHAYGQHIYKGDVRMACVWYMEHGIYQSGSNKSEEGLMSRLRSTLAERSIRVSDMHDYLTGLPSMTHFFALAENGCRKIREAGKVPVIMFMDHSGMKSFNQKYGLQDGDRLLKEFADKIGSRFQKECCSRFSADHFCVYTDRETAQKEAELLIGEISRNTMGKVLPLRIGMYLYEDEEISVSAACDRAKIACDSGRVCYDSKLYLFQKEMMTEIEKKQYIVEHLDRALREGWIRIFYQPIIRTANGKVCSEEALTRWEDPDKGELIPSDFIAALEDANNIHKLDLYVVERILRRMKEQEQSGEYVVPKSINLSKKDFYACDMVEEIRKRVDEAGIPRDRMVIEITEGVIAEDIRFMAKEIRRFKELGFSVWIDDYGRGSSSSAILQEIAFDVIKIDRHFASRIENSEKAKIIITEVIRMAMALGMDTVAEGVETEKEKEFLKEVGCTMFQGFYFSKPISELETETNNWKKNEIGVENPLERDYYMRLGKVNLYDLSIPRAEDATLNNYFDTWPMIMLECDTEDVYVVRNNETFENFVAENCPELLEKKIFHVADYSGRPGIYSLNAMMKCSRDGRKVIVDDRTSRGLNVQLLIWRVAVNPVTKRKAVVVALLQVEKDPEEKIMLTYNYIARALSQDYIYLYLVDLDTEQYTEYTPDGVNRGVSVERRGDYFFEEKRSKARSVVYRADQKEFMQAFTKENIKKNLLENDSFTIIYRFMEKGVPVYVSMKITKIRNKGNCVIIGVNNIDAQMKEKEALELEREERRVFSRMAALSGDFIVVYTVDLETNDYYRYAADEYQELFGENAYCDDFFRRTYEEAKALVYDDDKAYFYNRFRKEYIISEIRDRGMFIMHQYRLLIDRKPVYVKLKATIVHEDEADRMIMGIINIDAEVRREKEYVETIQLIETEALTDELTGVKRKHAYMDLERKINAEIIGGEQPAFAVGVFDINGLKEINDTLGHQAGDRYILEGCRIVCKTFQHSPVYRMGGDEFAVIAQGSDYKKMELLMSALAKKNEKNLKMGGVVVAAGMVKYTDETCVAEVFAKADAMMYQNKKMLKKKK